MGPEGKVEVADTTPAQSIKPTGQPLPAEVPLGLPPLPAVAELRRPTPWYISGGGSFMKAAWRPMASLLAGRVMPTTTALRSRGKYLSVSALRTANETRPAC